MSAPRLIKHERFSSRFLRNQRDLIVYLPPGYDAQPQRRFPVLYLHDGQNLFDGSTSFIPEIDWRVGQTADHFIHEGRVEPLIIVGICNAGKQRLAEYTPTRAPRLGGGSANRYAKFLLEEVRPFVISQYRAQEEPRTPGSEDRRLAAWFFVRWPAAAENFWKECGIVAVGLVERARHLAVRGNRAGPPLPRIWLDIGTREGPRIVDDVERFRDTLIGTGSQPR